MHPVGLSLTSRYLEQIARIEKHEQIEKTKNIENTKN